MYELIEEEHMHTSEKSLKEIAKWVRIETLKIHEHAPGTRLASSLSDVEIFVALYYGGVLQFDPENRYWEERDRLIISKGHGAISLYPILADLKYFDDRELERVCKKGTFLGSIPDTMVPGFETINGSLGHGLGVGCGTALALRYRQSKSHVFVLTGDGELFSGAFWEAIMFAGQHRLDNLTWILDNNKICMLDYCENIISLNPIRDKLSCFGWKVSDVNGHAVEAVRDRLIELKNERNGSPTVLIADTVKGKGVPQLETDSLCHIKSLTSEDVRRAIEVLS